MIAGRRRGLGDAEADAREASAIRWSGLIETTDQARAALGLVAEQLHAAYETLRVAGADILTETQMRQLLDGLNRQAGAFYQDAQAYADQDLDFSDAAPIFGRAIGQLYYDADQGIRLVSRISRFYDSGWLDAAAEAVHALPGMAKQAALDLIGAGKEAIEKAIGWPSWVIPTVTIAAVVGVGAWAYFAFLAPAGAGKKALAAVGV